MKNSNNMDWTDEEGDRYISMMVSACNLAIVVTGIFYPLLKNKSPKKLKIIAKIFFFASIVGITYPNLIIMIISRMVSGCSASIILSIGNSNAYLVSHPKHRSRSMIMYSLNFSFTFGLVSIISSFDDGGKLLWRLIFYAQALMVALDILIEVTYLRKTNAPFYIIKEKGTESMAELFQIVFQEEEAKMIAREHTRSLEEEKKAGEMGIKETIKLYDKEFVLTLIAGMSTTLTFYSVFYGYSTLWMTSDLENESEVSIAKIVSLLMALAQGVAKVFIALFNLIKKRISALLIAHILTFISWGLVWVTYITENLWFARGGGILLSFAIGGILFPAHFAYIAEISPPALISFGYTASELVALIANFVSPCFFGDASPRKNFVYGVPVIMLIEFLNLLMVFFFFTESYGLEKSQIYKKLRGKEFKVGSLDQKDKTDKGAAQAEKAKNESANGVEGERKALVDVVDQNQKEADVGENQKLEDIKKMVLGGPTESN